MKIERKKLSECTLDDLRRLRPRNRRCWDEDGNTDCNLFGAGTCPYLLRTDDDFDCAYFALEGAKTLEDVKEVIARFGDVTVRLGEEGEQ